MYNSFCKLAYKKKNILGDFIMKNTVKLEQFVALKEKDLQKIKGGEMRKMNEKSFNFFNIFRRR